MASQMRIARVSRPESSGVTSYTSALRSYFRHPRMLALGDIIGVRVKLRSSFSEDDEEEGDEGSDSEGEEESNHETNDLVYFTVYM